MKAPKSIEAPRSLSIAASTESASSTSPSSDSPAAVRTALAPAGAAPRNQRFTLHEIQGLKAKAKRLVKAAAKQGASMTHSAALDQVALEHRYRNWSLLKKDAAPAGLGRDTKPTREINIEALGDEELPDPSAILEKYMLESGETAAREKTSANQPPVRVMNIMVQALEATGSTAEKADPAEEPEPPKPKKSTPTTRSSPTDFTKPKKASTKSKQKTKAKSTSVPTDAKPRFWTVTHLSKHFAISMHQVKSVLMVNGMIGADGSPTANAIAAQAFNTKKIEDRFLGRGEITYFIWDLNKVEGYFEKPDEIAAQSHVKNRHQLCSSVKRTIVTAACELGYPLHDHDDAKTQKWAAKNGISEKELRLIIAFQYNDLHDSGLFEVLVTDSQKEAAAIFNGLEPVISKLEALLLLKKPKAAEVLRGVMSNLKGWLLRNTR